MRFNWKQLRLAMASAMILLGATGCGGINASHSISPASFFLPGLLKADPQPVQPDVTVPKPEPAMQVALAQ
jgi:hypothetical protein